MATAGLFSLMKCSAAHNALKGAKSLRQRRDAGTFKIIARRLARLMSQSRQ
jgi:hypothetical protein